MKKSAENLSHIRLSWWNRLLVSGIILSLCYFGAPGSIALAENTEDSSSGAHLGLGVASAILTLPYAAAKASYAAIGLLAGGWTFITTQGDLEATKLVLKTTAYGTYVLTPEHLQGEKPIEFFWVPQDWEHEEASIED